MRLLAFGLLLLAGPSLAQTPDPLDPRGYFPLAAGHVWEYRHDRYPFGVPPSTRYERYRIVGERTERDTLRFDMVHEVYDDGGRRLARDTVSVRYDDSTASVVGRYPEGAVREDPFPWFACGMDAPIGGPARHCWVGGQLDWYALPELTGSDEPVRVKSFSNFVYGFSAVHGIGFVSGGGGCEPCDAFSDYESWTLVYARVQGHTYGASVVSIERMPRAAEHLSVFPNPAHGRVTVRVPGAGPVELFDLLGRSVHRAIASGPGDVTLGLDGLPPGRYVVRANGGAQVLVVR